MKHQCLRGHVFLTPAKYIYDDTENPANTIEVTCCPVCAFTDKIIEVYFEEFVEAVEDIVSVKSVPLEECDKYIAEGYKVRELYAKTATLVKTEAKQP